jgi:Cof subfamily protein (haloacid dehalogenase superfamily)
MDRNLIALDLDGTLLNQHQEVTIKTKKVLQYLIAQGHEVMIATGRPPRSSLVYYNDIGMKTPMVNFNAAYISHPLDKSFPISHSPLDLKNVKEIIHSIEGFNMFNVITEVVDDVYIHAFDENLMNKFLMGNPHTTIGDIRMNLHQNPTAMLIQADEKVYKDIRNHLTHHYADVVDHRTWAAPWNVIEIIQKGISKGNGVAQVADYLNINRENVIAFGDEDNDLEMLHWAGTGVAMANGIDQVKDIANEITLSNIEEGVATYLIDYFKIPAHVYKEAIYSMG